MKHQSKYLLERRQLKLTAKPTKKEEKSQKEAKGVYFANMILQAPSVCENCGGVLHSAMAINPAAIVAHIIPKGKTTGCPSVALHPLNKFYACDICHHDFDNKGASFVQRMPIFEMLKERVAAFYYDIDPKEVRRVPEYFRPA